MSVLDPRRFAVAALLTIASSLPAFAEDANDPPASGAVPATAQGQDNPPPSGPGGGGVWGGLLGGDLGQAATDLRAASESAERWVLPLAGTIESVAASMARMSSGFDPFGYQASAATMTRQAEIIAEQQRTIDRLREAEIERLRAENRRLRQRLRRYRGQPGG